MLNAIRGTGKSLTCAEIVTAILHDPTRVDPLTASALRTIMTANRQLKKRPERLEKLRKCFMAKKNGTMRQRAHGPSTGLMAAAEAIGCHLDCVNSNIFLVNQFGARVALDTTENSTLASALREAARFQTMSILGERAARVNPKTGKATREDVRGIQPYIDAHTTTALINGRNSRRR